MSTLTKLMTHDHRSCDQSFADADKYAAEGDWGAAEQALQRFGESLLTHFTAEEQTLFPRFEEVTGMQSGPTQVMRFEHGQMREALVRMAEALAARDSDLFGGEAETLLVLMQQHNMKEESILYPMCDMRLAGELPQLLQRMSAALHLEVPV